jgi:hypothetical protein
MNRSESFKALERWLCDGGIIATTKGTKGTKRNVRDNMINNNIQTKLNQIELEGVHKDKKIRKSGSIRKDAHLSSRNKRDQGKRDEQSASTKST